MSWSLRGVDEQTREAVIEAARQSGLSVGEWLKAVLEDNDAPARRSAGRDKSDSTEAIASPVGRLQDRLADIEEFGRPRTIADEDAPNGLSAVIDDVARGLDTDEEARTEIEGLGDRRSPPPVGDPEAVSEAIRNLERQIAGLNQRIAAPAPAPDRPASLEEIRDQLNALLARPPSRPAPPPNRAALDKALSALEARIDEARRRVASSSGEESSPGGRPTDRLEARLAEITKRLGPAPAAQRERPGRPAAANLASAIAEISERQRKLDRNAEVLTAEIGHKSLANALAALRADVATLTERVTAIGGATARAGESHSDLARRIDAVAAAQPQLLDAIRDDLSVVRTALADGARRARANGDTARLDRFAQEISALRRSLETAQGPGTNARLEAQVAELARVVESALSARTGQPDAFELLKSNLDDIRRSIDALQPAGAMTGADTALSRLDTRLNHIAARIDRVLERAAPVEALDAIKSEIAALRTELAGQTRISGDQLAAQIRALADGLDAVTGVNGDGPALTELEAQIAAIAEQIGRTLPRPATLQRVEESLSQLQDSLAGDHGGSVEAARTAATEAVREVSASRRVESTLIQSLRNDLDDLRKAAEAADRDEQGSPTAANETLTEVVRRLSQLERETTEGAVAVGRAPTTPRANRAAAAAWNAAYRGGSSVDVPTASTARADIAALRELVASGGNGGQRGSDRRGDFIAAARRAAQAAEAVARGEQSGAAKSSTFTRIGEAIRGRKGSLLVAAAAVALALGAIQLYGGADDGGEPSLIGPTEADTVAPTAIDRDEALATTAPPMLANGHQPALVALPGTPDAALAFAEPLGLADRFGGIVTGSPGGFTASDAAGPVRPDDALLEAAGAAPWPDAPELAAAAAGGDAAAAFSIAARYARSGSTEDLAKALGWYRRAAEQGNVEAMHNLAVLLSEGAGQPAHAAEALTWFLAAAEHGVADSQYNLGVIYARGIGVERDFAEAYRWFAIAAAQGDLDAAERRDQIGARLPPDRAAEAQALADSWRVTPVVAAANQMATVDGWDTQGDGVDTADRQALVRKIQTLLAEQGYDPGPADGVEGPMTRQAIRAYQHNIGLSETGRIDGSLVTALADTRG